ncbi:hypothetical protein F4604DRAFT_721282 [Suillus subluteus]|nr:hypothetical protein F4604DRAFT_721282 [Suillus subluteus]
MGSLESTPTRAKEGSHSGASSSTFAFSCTATNITCHSSQVYGSGFNCPSETRRPRRAPNPCCFHTAGSQRSSFPYGTPTPLKNHNPPPNTISAAPKPGSSSSSSSNHTDATRFTQSGSSSSAFTSTSSIAPAIKVSLSFLYFFNRTRSGEECALYAFISYRRTIRLLITPALRKPLHLRPSDAVDTFDFDSTLTSPSLKVDRHLLRLNKD